VCSSLAQRVGDLVSLALSYAGLIGYVATTRRLWEDMRLADR
jgi:hypothetical protein